MDPKVYTFLCFVIPYLTIGDIANKAEMKRNMTEDPKINSIYEEKRNYQDNTTYVCPRDEVFKLCESCTKFCRNESNICKEPCGGGCYCNRNLIEDSYSKCIKYEECSRPKRDGPATELPIPYQLSCSEHQVYSACRRCDKTCTDPNPSCNGSCIAGCFCDDGYLKAPDGRCILLKDCPRAEITIGNDPSIDECQPDEVFVWCGWCEGSCSEPAPQCPETCTRGCLCRPPLLRHYSGLCVEAKDCLPQKCTDTNEEYSCRYGCEERCAARACGRPRGCRLGCHCRRGLLRSAGGQCVTAAECADVPNVTMIY